MKTAYLVAGILIGLGLSVFFVGSSDASEAPCEFRFQIRDAAPGKDLVAYECPDGKAEWRFEESKSRKR